MSGDDKKWYELPEILDENGYHKALWWEIHEKEVSEQIQCSNSNSNVNSALVCLNRHGFILIANGSDIRIMLPRDMEGIVPGTKETVSQGEAKKNISFDGRVVAGIEVCSNETNLALISKSNDKSIVESFHGGNLLLTGENTPLLSHSFEKEDIIFVKFVKDLQLLCLTSQANLFLLTTTAKTKLENRNVTAAAVFDPKSNALSDGILGKMDGSLSFFSIDPDANNLKIVKNSSKPKKFDIAEDDVEIYFLKAHFVKPLGPDNILVLHQSKVIFDGDEEDFEYKYQFHVYEISSDTWTLILNEANQPPINIEIEDVNDMSDECNFFADFISSPWYTIIVSASHSNQIALIGLNPTSKKWNHWKPNRADEADFDNIQLPDLDGEEQFVNGMTLSLNFQSEYPALSKEESPDIKIPPSPNIIVTTRAGSILRLTLADEFLLGKKSENFMMLNPVELAKQNIATQQQSKSGSFGGGMKFAEKKDSINESFQLKSGVGSEAKKTEKPSFGFGFTSEKKEPLVNQNDGFGKKKAETPFSFGNTNASKQNSSGFGSEAKETEKPSFGFGFTSEKKEPLVNQNDGFGKKKAETPFSFGNTNASKQNSKFGDASTVKIESEVKGITRKTDPNTASEPFSKSHQNHTPFQSKNIAAVKSPAKNVASASQSLLEENQANKITRARRPKRQISKYERVVQEAFIRYFEGGGTGDVLGNNQDQTSMQERALSNVQDSKRQLQDLDARITTLTQTMEDMSANIVNLRNSFKDIQAKSGQIKTTYMHLARNKDNADLNPLPSAYISQHQKRCQSIVSMDKKLKEIIEVMNLKKNKIESDNKLASESRRQSDISSRRRLLHLVRHSLSSGVEIIKERAAKLDNTFLLLQQTHRVSNNSTFDTHESVDSNGFKSDQYSYADTEAIVSYNVEGVTDDSKAFNGLQGNYDKIEEFEDLLMAHCEMYNGYESYIDGELSRADLDALYRAGGNSNLLGEDAENAILEEQRYGEKQSKYMLSMQSHSLNTSQTLNTPMHNATGGIVNKVVNDQTMMSIVETSSMTSTFRSTSMDNETLKIGSTINERRSSSMADSSKRKNVSFGFSSKPLSQDISEDQSKSSNGNLNGSGVFPGADFGKSVGLGVIKEESTEDSSFALPGENQKKLRLRDAGLKVDDLSGSNIFGGNGPVKNKAGEVGADKPSFDMGKSEDAKTTGKQPQTGGFSSSLFGSNDSGSKKSKVGGLNLFGQSNNGDNNKNDSKVSKPLGFGKSEKGIFASKSFGSQSTTENNTGEGGNVKKSAETSGGISIGASNNTKAQDPAKSKSLFGSAPTVESAQSKITNSSNSGGLFGDASTAPTSSSGFGSAGSVTSSSSGFGNTNLLGATKASNNPIATVAMNNNTASQAQLVSNPVSSGGLNYKAEVTKIYQQYNPTKIGSIDSLLQKYKGQEARLLEKLKKKYMGNAAAGIGSASNNTMQQQGTNAFGGSGIAGIGQQQTGGFGTNNTKSTGNAFGTVSSGFGNTGMSSTSGGFGGLAQSSGNSFGTNAPNSSSSNPFASAGNNVANLGSNQGGFGAVQSNSGFGAPAANNNGNMFGGAQQTSNAFGQNAMSKQTSGGFGATTSGFGSSMTNSASAFGSAGQTGTGNGFGGQGQNGSFGTGFGNSNTAGASGFGGKTNMSGFGQNNAGFGSASGFGSNTANSFSNNNNNASNIRDQVIKIYQQYNPSKLGQVDANLMKYRGREQVLLEKLRKKYMGGNPGGFGNGFSQQSNNSAFGNSNAGFGTSNMAGQNSGFGQTNAFGQSTNTGFGSNSNAFGSKNTSASGFGASTSGFGNTGGFGQTANNAFGSNNSTGNNGFGSNNNSSAFGTNTSGFGSSTNTGFGNSQMNASGFGAQNTGFGASNASGFGSSTTSGFGGGFR